MTAESTSRQRRRKRLSRIGLVSLLAAVAVAAGPVGTASADPDDSYRYWYIVNSSTGMMVEILGNSADVGAPAILWPHYGGWSQQFEAKGIEKAGAWFNLRAHHSDLCLETEGFAEGVAVRQAECGGKADQLWRVRAISKSSAECANPNQCFPATRTVLENYYDRGKRCLDAANGAFPSPPRQGTPIHAWNCIGRYSAPNFVNQEWQLVRVHDFGEARGPVVR